MNKFRKLSRISLVMACAAVVMLSIAVKFLLTSGDLLPGRDGAFYWVQVRSLLINGKLAYPDMPLVFWVQAILAKLLGDIPLAVRLSDAILPTLAAFPLFLLFKAGKAEKPRFALPLILLVVLLHPIQLYYFTGDFVKNEAALPLIFLLGWLLTRWNPDNKWTYSTGILATLTTATFSHYGVLLLGLVITFLWVVARLSKRSPKFWLLTVGSVVFAITGVLVLLSFMVPTRFDRLLNLLGNLDSLVKHPMGMFIFWGALRPVMLFAVVSGQLGSVMLGILVWRSRKELSFTTKSALVSFLTTAFLFSSPVVGIEWAERLTAMSFAPLVLAALVFWLNTSAKSALVVITILAVSTILVSAILVPTGPTPPVLNQVEWKDFQELVAKVNLERPSLVVARHGVDFLVAWYLNTDVVEEDAADLNSGSEYQARYVLKQGKDNSGSKGLNFEGIIVFENNTFTLSRLK